MSRKHCSSRNTQSLNPTDSLVSASQLLFVPCLCIEWSNSLFMHFDILLCTARGLYDIPMIIQHSSIEILWTKRLRIFTRYNIELAEKRIFKAMQNWAKTKMARCGCRVAKAWGRWSAIKRCRIFHFTQL